MKSFAPLLEAARGREPADLVLKGGRVLNVFTGEFEETDLAVKDGWIVGLGRYEGREEMDASGRAVVPGFIDPHLHIESTRLCPGELAKIVVPRGTTAIVADPHEIANVLGLKGIFYLLELTSGLPLDVFFMAPSCVPATHLETSGAILSAEDLRPLLDEPRVLGLAEVMNFPGAINGLREVIEKIDLFSAKPVDGHAPLLSGPDLCAYLLLGIGTDHECTNPAEAGEKLARGMRVFIREGSQAKNLADLLPLISDRNFRRTAFCTDDRHPEDLTSQGHLDHVLRRAVSLGLDPVRALIMATLNAAEAFGLKRRGALAPGYLADISILKSIDSFVAERVYKGGRLVALDGELVETPAPVSIPDWAGPMNIGPLNEEKLKTRAVGARVRVIEIIPGQLLTGHLILETPARDGFLAADPQRDLARLVVVERHHRTGNVGHGLVKGFGFHRGAIASSVAHDSHNIVAAGLNEADILLAVRTVEKMRGGLAATAEGRVLAELALPLAGLMSPEPVDQIVSAAGKLTDATRGMGSGLDDPFMILSFLALPVIPRLKLTDRGLVDVGRFEFVPLFIP